MYGVNLFLFFINLEERKKERVLIINGIEGFFKV